MNVNIQATGIELTSAIKEYIEKKLSLIEEKLVGEPENATAAVEVGKTTEHHQTGDIFRAETVLILHDGGQRIVAVAEKDDLYAAIDEMKDTLERELVKKKDKTRTLRRRGAGLMKRLLRKSRQGV